VWPIRPQSLNGMLVKLDHDPMTKTCALNPDG
jgi:hypothetical protein